MAFVWKAIEKEVDLFGFFGGDGGGGGVCNCQKCCSS